MIELPIEIGSTILRGKFRNKKVIVKTISKNERGEPLINDKPILSIRLTDLKEIIRQEIKNVLKESLK